MVAWGIWCKSGWGIAVSVARLHTVIEPESWFIGGSCGIAVSVARLHRDRI